MDYVKSRYSTKDIRGIRGRVFLTSDQGEPVLVAGEFGFGAPVTTAILEELIGLGLRRFIAVGTAASIQYEIPVGTIVVCDKAIRDEGTSYHYTKPSKYAYPSQHLRDVIVCELKKKNVPFHIGPSWTTDAPYRETKEEILRYQREGIATIDMEASALFSVAAFRDVQICSQFVVSDSIADLVYSPHLYARKTLRALERLTDTAISVLSASGGSLPDRL